MKFAHPCALLISGEKSTTCGEVRRTEMHNSRWRKRAFAATAFGLVALAALAGGAGTGGAAVTVPVPAS